MLYAYNSPIAASVSSTVSVNFTRIELRGVTSGGNGGNWYSSVLYAYSTSLAVFDSSTLSVQHTSFEYYNVAWDGFWAAYVLDATALPSMCPMAAP